MHLKSLSLLNYKNIESKKLDFDPRINCFVGNNGVGKTNILDAIYHLSFGKSYFNPITSQNIMHHSDFFMLEGLYERNDRDEKVGISAKRSTKKKLSRNGKEFEKISEHIGFLPLVIISPADSDLISDGSAVRRKFVDGVLSQTNAEYLQQLLNYNKTLSQRNALLKYFAANHTYDSDNLEIYNEQLASYGSYLYEKRKAFVATFAPLLIKRYNYLSQSKERIDISYQSKLHETSLKDLLASQLAKDRVLQYTSSGIHKDDLAFNIDGFPIKKFGSQGQQKSFLIALKLAQFDFLLHTNQTAPIILLDDIFDKLDEHRVKQLIQLVDDAAFGQIFVSDTHQDRTENVVKSISQSYKIFNLNEI